MADKMSGIMQELWIGEGLAEGLTVTKLEIDAVRTWCRTEADRFAEKPHPDADEVSLREFLAKAAAANDNEAARRMMNAKSVARATNKPYTSVVVLVPRTGVVN